MLFAETNPLASIMALAHVKGVKVSSSALFEIARHTRVEETITVPWIGITEAVAPLADSKNALALE